MSKKKIKIDKNTIRKSAAQPVFKQNKKTIQKSEIITVKNAEGDPDTQATVLIRNKIDYVPKVSVIIPVYNGEQYLRECLDSVVNQTLKDIEIICVDDGSTDTSLEILKEYAKKDNRITIITQENLGSGIARNCGINVANGDFVGFMDSDDFYPSNNTLKHVYNAAIKHKVLICGGSLNRLDNNGILITDKKAFESGYIFDKNCRIKYFDYQFDYGYWRFIYNRELLQTKKLLFPDFLRQQDPVFFVRAMIAAGEFYALSEPTYVYRVSHTQKQIVWTYRKCIDVAKSLRDLLILSDEFKLTKLHLQIANRLCNNYFVNI